MVIHIVLELKHLQAVTLSRRISLVQAQAISLTMWNESNPRKCQSSVGINHGLSSCTIEVKHVILEPSARMINCSFLVSFINIQWQKSVYGTYIMRVNAYACMIQILNLLNKPAN